MKSESVQKMMIRCIFIFGLVLLALAKSEDAYEIKQRHFRAIDLDKHSFHSTKNRPELDPITSALINADVRQSIDAKKRHAEYDSSPLSEASKVGTTIVTTTTSAPVQTTVKYIPKAQDDTVVVDSLVDSTSEKKQTSRIEVKKGPNGVDYEYEYVYYYYDDDKDKDTKKSATVTDDKSIESQNNGKNRYDKISTTPKPSFERNELPTSRGKGRQSIPVVEETSEERLPVNTRFPPRSTATPSVQVLSNVDETTKKISIKRPSLELVDSQSFNRGEKVQSKGRILENEFSKANDLKISENPTNTPSVTESVPQSATSTSDSEETTTQVMDKVALDLYAHLVNENSNIDLSTSVTPFDESSTLSDSLPITTEELITTETLTTTTAASTTEATTTTTTTTTTEPSTLINGRRTPSFGAGRRNTLKGRSKPTESKVTSEEQLKESSPLSSEITSTQNKPKNRFSRPTFSGRTRPTSTAVTSTEEDLSVKSSTKPVSVSASVQRGRTRNRFNLRSSTPVSVSSEEKNADENAIDTSAQSTSTQRPLRTRPTFNLRGRSRATASSTAAPLTDGNTESSVTEAKLDGEEKSSTAAALKPSSRFNLRRPNQLLSTRGRISPFAKVSASAEQSLEISSSTELTAGSSTSTVDTNKESAADAESEQIAAEPSTTPQTGLNRLRNRPRIQIQPKATNTNKQPTAASYINANRKVNPLISRRKIGSSTTTEETPATENNEASEEVKHPQSELKEDSLENEGNAKEEEAPPALVEASSEAPRGLGLLANRRRLAIRRPGTI
ncbi:uncharacterized serine-rich protein C215.13 [Contarinia nasturtii]|uniref:uncharacterized serine-rich protein C215.13 n=1 Tax=Contarinia nasturtii TaxID=265458 RepID=UPI0012D43DFF|nr:uncharacterized serine-rich protein C215.13 [Contarinia nasturtii]XP_031640836.1 uncharacterized serine-rich protein C215.13 [Contarinia nasturtii]XP_031640837.1 uncharacterized serine-rich protein C215.13 [Contarinia nasturtii]XP_031640838.1 uncharacterized serine-rich protein C215.13 [Contarinia nasturtii]